MGRRAEQGIYRFGQKQQVSSHCVGVASQQVSGMARVRAADGGDGRGSGVEVAREMSEPEGLQLALLLKRPRVQCIPQGLKPDILCTFSWHG